MQNELISIIIPVYNVEKYLRKCVDSVLAQTYTNLEIILVDDGSPDGCGAVCDEYAKQDKRVRVIHKPNGGLSSARNAGLDTAKGEWIGFVDSDDWILPTMYEKLYAAARNENADMAACTADVFGPRNQGNVRDYYQVDDAVLSPKDAFYRVTHNNAKFPLVAWNKLYKKHLFKDLRYPDGRAAEDAFVIHYIIDRCYKIVTISESLYMHLRSYDSIMGRIYSGAKVLDGFDATWDRYIFLKAKGQEYKTAARGALHICAGEICGAFLNTALKDSKDTVIMRYRKTLWALIKSGDIKWVIWLFIHRRKSIYKLLKWGWHTVTKKNVNNKPKWVRKIKYARKKNLPLFINMGTASHGNIGDAAISAATVCFLCDCLQKHVILEINDIDCDRFLELYTKKFADSSDTLIIKGGGFLGTLWFAREKAARQIIGMFPNNKIVIFPQTIYFENSDWGNEEITNTRTVWAAHNDLHVCLREENSYNFALTQLNRNTLNTHLIPDIVLYLKSQKRTRRKGVLFCLRRDKEKISHVNDIERLKKFIANRGFAATVTDTVIKTHFILDGKMRHRKFNKKLNEFRSAKLVITDRLHGMIFAAITGTPCVALNQVSKKVQGVYEWLKELDYIKFANTVEEACKYADELLADSAEHIYDNAPLMPYFNKLADIVRERERERENSNTYLSTAAK